MTPSPAKDRITQLRIKGLRVIDDLTLDLDGLTVLIGDNGTGKSSILEALELLRHAAKRLDYVPDIIQKIHSGFAQLLRRGSEELRLGVTIEGSGPKLEYEFSIRQVGPWPAIWDERLDEFALEAKPLHWITRAGTKAQVLDEHRRAAFVAAAQSPPDRGLESLMGDTVLALPIALGRAPVFERVIKALEEIEWHAPFEARPLWQQHELKMREGPRWASRLERTNALGRYALNLPNAYHQLRNLGGKVWERVLDQARLGLGDDLRDFSLSAFGGGEIMLEVVFGTWPDRPMPAESLSEGQLSYLAFIALVELNVGRSVLALDEPELHLHPGLLARVVWMLEEVAETTPVILATHSDRLLDALTEPAKSIVLCDLDAKRATRLRRVNPDQLERWLENYTGFGKIRAEGYQSHLFIKRDQTRKPML